MNLIDTLKTYLPIGPYAEEADGTQYGVIPYRIVEGEVVFLMITSRRSANWVFPKGSPIKGLSSTETAAQEAFEEAGIRGKVGDEAVGYYLHPRNKDASKRDKVKLYPMLVTEQLDEWEEEEERFRHWALLPQVKQLMASKRAARLAAELHRRIRDGNYAPGNKRMSA